VIEEVETVIRGTEMMETGVKAWNRVEKTGGTRLGKKDTKRETRHQIEETETEI
jgi:hypothetical protein